MREMTYLAFLQAVGIVGIQIPRLSRRLLPIFVHIPRHELP